MDDVPPRTQSRSLLVCLPANIKSSKILGVNISTSNNLQIHCVRNLFRSNDKNTVWLRSRPFQNSITNIGVF